MDNEQPKKEKTKLSKRSRLQCTLATIMTIILFVIVSIMMSAVVSLVFKTDDLFYASTIGSTVAILLTFAIWMPVGVEQGLNEANYVKRSTEYFRMANYIVDNQLFKQLREFCRYKNDSNRKNIIIDLLSTENIEYRLYELQTKLVKTEEEQKELDLLLKGLTERQHKWFDKVLKKRIRFEELTPKNITSGRTRKNVVVNHNHETAYVVNRMLTKILWGIFTTCFSYFVVISPSDGFGYPQIIMIGMWSFTFLMAIYSAIKIGYNKITKQRCSFYVDQCDSCAEFFDYIHLPLTKVTESSNGQEN